jgi:hypothetical protein
MREISAAGESVPTLSTPGMFQSVYGVNAAGRGEGQRFGLHLKSRTESGVFADGTPGFIGFRPAEREIDLPPPKE